LIARYGYDVVGVVLAICIIGILLAWLFVDGRVLKTVVFLLLGGLLLFTLYFFRDPERNTPTEDGLVISPADGTVLSVQETREDDFLHADAVQVSIFMSPLNVHVNRYPVTGVVGFFRHYPGEFLVAFDEKASLRNERTHIGIDHPRGKVLFKQIAGFVARRIVAEVRVGDQATAGRRFGMIKFGSRVDVLVPRGTEVLVKPGDRMVAGETVLAVLPRKG
jgi:phosphatidylserine decarboxylase